MNRTFLWLLIALAQLLMVALVAHPILNLLTHAPSYAPGDFSCFRDNAGKLLGHLAPINAGDRCFFMYPPPFILLLAPTLLLTPPYAYTAWIIAGLAALAAAARGLGLPWRALGLALFTLPVTRGVEFGQSGLIISSLLLVSLGTKRPVAAGIAAGCLIIKPQFALLLPVCYLAERNWRALASAAATAATLLALSAVILGPRAWMHLLTAAPATATAILQMPWPQLFQAMMVSVFMSARSLHLALGPAYALQLCAGLAAAAAAWRLWSRPTEDPTARRAATLCLVLLATPYVYIYDLPALTVALAAFGLAANPDRLLVTAAFWVFLALDGFIVNAGYSPGGLFLPVIATVLLQQNGVFHPRQAQQRPIFRSHH